MKPGSTQVSSRLDERRERRGGKGSAGSRDQAAFKPRAPRREASGLLGARRQPLADNPPRRLQPLALTSMRAHGSTSGCAADSQSVGRTVSLTHVSAVKPANADTRPSRAEVRPCISTSTHASWQTRRATRGSDNPEPPPPHSLRVGAKRAAVLFANVFAACVCGGADARVARAFHVA